MDDPLVSTPAGAGTGDSRHILVLGATGGIGSAVTRRLIHGGVRVTAAARGRERLDGLARDTGAGPLSVDATDVDAVAEVAARARAAAGRLDGVVNCVGSWFLKPAHLTSGADWHATLAANLTTAFAAVRAAGIEMREPGGAVVLVSSAAAQLGLANHEAIAAAKAGVAGLTRAAAATYAGSGIRVNAVAPGLVDTPLAGRITGNPASLNASARLHPLGRIGTAEEIASAIVWLLDPVQAWVTGQVLGVDGGLATVRSVR